MGVILREIIPNGDRWGELGEVIADWTNLEFGQDLKSAASITFNYPNAGVHSDKLRTGMYIVPEVNGRIDWFDSIFYVQELTGSSMPNTPGLVTYAGTSLKRKLDEMNWMPAVGSNYIDSEGFRYTNATPGDVLGAGVENYLSRARKTFKDPIKWISRIEKGSGWMYRVDEVIVPPTSVMSMVQKYQDLGIATTRFYGFEVIFAHYDWFVGAAFRDKSDTVQLKVGVNLTDGDYSESNKELVTALLVKGAADPFLSDEESNIQTNVVQWVTAPQNVIDKWGYHERVLDVGDASNPETLKAIGQNYIAKFMEPRYSTSFTMVDTLHDPLTGQLLNTPQVLSDFQCGDEILVLTDKGAVKEKVYAISLTYDTPSKSPKIVLTLNDYFDTWEVTFNQRLQRLGG